MAAANQSKRLPILSLGLPPPAQRLTHNLLPDAYTPAPTSLLSTPDSTPSLLRRSRPVPHGAAFSYVSPLVLGFPYDFPAEQVEENGDSVSLGEQHRRENEEGQSSPGEDDTPEKKYERQMKQVEKMMRRYEVQPSELGSPEYPPTEAGSSLGGYLSPARRASTFPSARLLALSPAAIRECLPDLDVGDAYEFIKKTSGRDGPDTYSSGAMASKPSDEAARARIQLSDVLSGRVVPAVLPSSEAELDELAGCGVWARKVGDAWKDEKLPQRWARRRDELEKRKSQNTYMPWANAYAGHQFGSWAGQLGDGRAITLFETLNHHRNPPERWEVQLKGAGRTPYSRFADGLAVLASSVREFLGSEIIAGLGIPTSRALSVISISDVEVIRERRNVSAITSRLAQSWIRIGSFQLPASRSDWESVRLMGEYVGRVLFGFDGIPAAQDDDSKREKWATKLLLESARRNARMVAGWQYAGWAHGVLNTDNISILGLTIDYGPYGFLDIFSPDATPNHSDESARYSYKLQPSMVLFAMRQLQTALSPIIGFEDANGRAPNPGELAAMKSEDLEELAEVGEALVRSELNETFVNETMTEWRRRFRGRLGLLNAEDDEKSNLLDPLLDTLEEVDFTNTLRNLVRFPLILEEHVKDGAEESGVSAAVDAFLPTWYDDKYVLEFQRSQKSEQAHAWLTKYAQRILRDLKANSNVSDAAPLPAGWGSDFSSRMKQTNPKFVLRNWVGEEVIKRLEEGDDTDFLHRVLNMCLDPYKERGQAEEGKSEDIVKEERRLCEVGEPLQRNMPSCSS